MNNTLPVMLLKGLVLLPNQEVKLDINNKISKKLIMIASKNYNNEIMIVCPKDQKEEDPEVTDLPFVGVLCKIISKIELPNGHLKVKVSGKYRVSILEYSNNLKDNDMLECSYNKIDIPKFNEVEEVAARRKLIEVLKKYIDIKPEVSNSILGTIKDEKDLYKITDQITLFIPLSFEKKLNYMEEINAIKRAHNLIKDLSIEIEISLLDDKIDEDLNAELENTQKEFILREKIKQIKKELGEENLKDEEVLEFIEKLNELDLNLKTKNKLMHEIKKYEFTSDVSPDASSLRNYLDWTLNLPWNNISEDEYNLEKIRKSLNKSHYKMEEVKDRIIEYIAVKKRNSDIKSPIICLIGPPGVGKTTFASSIATALNKEFAKISVGGLNDSSELIGHRRTYIGSSPGKIIQSIRKCNTKNPLILIDEVDKMVKDYKGDPSSTLLDILDPLQNINFIDSYIEEPFDLSKVLFVLTANNKSNIPSELLDRLEIIDLNSYTEFEKIDIAKKYLIPKIYKEHKIMNKELKISDDIISKIILEYTNEAGVRDLDRMISTVVRKIITDGLLENSEHAISVTTENILKYLGEIKFSRLNNYNNFVGVVNGLSYTPSGGMVMPIESCMYEGKGNIKLTGMLGEVLKESIEVAFSYIKNNKDYFKINDYYFNNRDFHIHALEGAIKKEGPSAGITIVTSLISLLLNKKVNPKIGMTGEVSLNGEVLEIGGLKEKLIGAYNSGIEIVLIPTKNHKDLSKIPEEIIKNIEIIEVSNYREIYNIIFG